MSGADFQGYAVGIAALLTGTAGAVGGIMAWWTAHRGRKESASRGEQVISKTENVGGRIETLVRRELDERQLVVKAAEQAALLILNAAAEARQTLETATQKAALTLELYNRTHP